MQDHMLDFVIPKNHYKFNRLQKRRDVYRERDYVGYFLF